MGNELKLINGRFDPEQAKSVLTLVANAKIKYHTEKVNNSKNMSEENIMHSEKRIVEIQNQLRDLLLKIDTAQKEGKKVDIDATINVALK